MARVKMGATGSAMQTGFGDLFDHVGTTAQPLRVIEEPKPVIEDDRAPHPLDVYEPTALEGTPYTCEKCGETGKRIVLMGGFARPELCGGCFVRLR